MNCNKQSGPNQKYRKINTILLYRFIMKKTIKQLAVYKKTLNSIAHDFNCQVDWETLFIITSQ